MAFRAVKEQINKFVNVFTKAYDISKDTRLTKKPLYEVFFNQRPGIKHPEVTPTIPLLKYVHDNSPAIKIATMRLRESIFRRGFEWERNFEAKCTDCLKEFEDIVRVCDSCGSTNIDIPNKLEIKRAEKFFETCNIYDPAKMGKRKLIHLLKQLEDDLNVYDDCYLVGIKEYWQNADGDIKLTTLHQILRGNPVTMRLVVDELGEPGGKWACCLRHRDVIEEISDGNLEELRCPKCNRKLYEVHYVSVEGGGDNPTAYYIGDEVIHCCYDDQTEILTKDGFKLFKDLNNDDVVATLNKENNNLEYQKPTEIQSYDYNGEMYNINSRRVNLCVTPNHRMYVKKQHGDNFEFIEAQNLNKHSYHFKKDCEWVGEKQEHFILPNIDKKDNLGFLNKRFDDIKIPMNLWLEFLGYYLSEGSCSYSAGGYHIGISQSKEVNPEKYEKINNCLNQISAYWYKDNVGFGLSNKQLFLYLEQFGKAKDKFIPRNLFNLSKEQLLILFNALLLGDGRIHNGYGYYYSSSKQMANDMCELSIKCGYTSKLTLRVLSEEDRHTQIKGRDVYFRNSPICYIVNISGIDTIKYSGEPGIKTKVINKLNYNGKVYCCTVPNSVIMVRRNGVHIWCGNSKYSPSSLYGFSPIVTLWQYTLTLTNMVEYIYRSYSEAHLPKGVLAMKTSNPDSAYEFWKDVDDKLNKDPHYIPKMFLEGEGNGTGSGMEFIKFMDTLEEMQYIPVRDEIRRTIASMYGVTNIFIGDTAGAGGLNADSTQIDITNMAAESGIAVYNDHIMPELLYWLNVNDWSYVLRSPFEENMQRELNEQQTKVGIAQSMLQMGFKVDLGEEDVFDFKYSGESQDQSGGQPANPDGGVNEPGGGFTSNPEQGNENDTFNDSDIKMGIQKARIYVKHPKEAPQGAKVLRSPRGSFYYDTQKPSPYQDMRPRTDENKRKRIEALLHNTTEHYDNLLEEYKQSKDINPGHAMSLQSDLSETRQLIQHLHTNYRDMLGDEPEEVDKAGGRSININITKKCEHDWNNMSSLNDHHQKCSKCGKIKIYREGTHDVSQRWEYKQGVPDNIQKMEDKFIELKKNHDDELEILKYDGQEADTYQVKKFKNELNKIFEEEIAKILNNPVKFAGVEQERFVKKVLDDAIFKMEAHTRRHLEMSYREGQKYVGELVGKAIDFSKIDKAALHAITSRNVLWKSYENLSKATSEKFNEIIKRSFTDPKKYSIPNIVKDMRSIADHETYRLERIARTESHVAAMTGREISFQKSDPDGENLYKWAIKRDSRTSSACLDIEKQVNAESNGKGVSLQRLKDIIKENSLRYNGPKWEYRDFQPHISCRSGLVRAF